MNYLKKISDLDWNKLDKGFTFKQSVIYYIIMLSIVLLLVSIVSCSGDSSVTNPVNPPSAQDSIVLLNSPANDTVFNTPDSIQINFKWKTNIFAVAYDLQISSDSTFSNPPNIFSTTISDTSVTYTFLSGPTSDVRYWRVRIFRSSSPYAPWSEIRKFSVQ